MHRYGSKSKLCNVAMKLYLLSLHIFILTCHFCFAVTWYPSVTSIYLSVSSNETGIKSETYGVIWQVSSEYKIQLVNCELSPRYLTYFLSLPDICAIDAYIFWLLSLSPFSYYFWDAQLPLSLKRTCFRSFLLSLGVFGNLAIRLSTDPHLKQFQGVRSVHCLYKSPAARAFSLSFIVLLKHFSEEWLAPPQKVHFFWTIYYLWLFLPEPELLLII